MTPSMQGALSLSLRTGGGGSPLNDLAEPYDAAEAIVRPLPGLQGHGPALSHACSGIRVQGPSPGPRPRAGSRCRPPRAGARSPPTIPSPGARFARALDRLPAGCLQGPGRGPVSLLAGRDYETG